MKPLQDIGEAVEAIERAILPGLPGLLDELIDKASLARPGVDAENYADDIRGDADRVGALALLVAAVAPQPQPAAAVPRMSA